MTNHFKAPKGARAERKAEGAGNYLRCDCGGKLDKVVDSRGSVVGQGKEPAVRRRRVCDQCGNRSTTIELTEEFLLTYRAEFLKEIAIRIISGEIA